VQIDYSKTGKQVEEIRKNTGYCKWILSG